MQNYIFDFDLTLIDSGKVNVLSTQSAFKKMDWPAPTAETVRYYTGIPIEDSFRRMAPVNISPESFQRLLKTFIQDYEALEPGNLHLFPGIKAALDQLKAAGHQLFIATSNRTSVVTRNTKLLDIFDDFTEIVGFDQVEHAKPAPDTVLKIINDHHLDPAETIMIGDATYDLEMGKNAGVHTAGVLWGAHDPASLKQVDPDYLLSNVEQLLTIR